VDWWVILKEPDGLNYVYLDAESKTFKQGKATLKGGALGSTFAQFYDSGAKSTFAYAMWNDEFPDGSKHDAPSAHAKGALGFSASGGVWITHSVPKFPGKVSDGWDGSWDTASDTYGQSFLCVSLPASSVEDVAHTMQVDRLAIFDSSLPAGMQADFPEFRALVEKDKCPDATRQATIKSRKGKKFLRISKSGHWATGDEHFYEALVAPAVGANLATETWQNGIGSMASDCSDKFQVMNVRHVAVTGDSDGWNSSNDHSKWAMTVSGSTLRKRKRGFAVSASPPAAWTWATGIGDVPGRLLAAAARILDLAGPWLRAEPPAGSAARRLRAKAAGKKTVCIGDINRQTGQANRGGGTVCLLDSATVWKAFNGVVQKIEVCP
jgi:hypothetical protein